MKVLFTGASSFTGYWFVKELAAAGHEIVAVFRCKPDDYPDELRKRRAAAAADLCRPIYGVAFGDERFIELIREGGWTLLCCHGAEAKNYNNPAFDLTAALSSNTHRLPLVLDSLLEVGCSKVALTGSVFEADEGAGSDDRPAFSPYGLSKAFTWQLFKYECQLRSMALGKFVIPNPFGPYEERRFTHHLMKTWFAGETPVVNTPSYVRDNIHVSLLAKSYQWFCAHSMNGAVSRFNPSGYVESQGAFAKRVADEMRSRLGLACDLKFKHQTEFTEPPIRINTDRAEAKVADWNQAAAWDEFADYYARLMNRGA